MLGGSQPFAARAVCSLTMSCDCVMYGIAGTVGGVDASPSFCHDA